MRTYRPVFVMGAPRSGTTMLASSLASAQNVLALPEMHFMHPLLQQELLGTLPDRTTVAAGLLEDARFMALGVISDRSEVEWLIGGSVTETITNIINRYNDLNRQKSFGVWLEHTPHNHRYFEVLQACYPDALFLHIVRDGRAVYRSTRETDWGYKDVVTGASCWRETVTECLVLARTHQSKVRTICYEELTSDPETTLEAVCKFAGLVYTPEMLNNNGIINPGFSRFQRKIGRRLDTDSQALWKKTLKPYEIAHFNAVNGDLLELLGYGAQGCCARELKGIARAAVRLQGRLKMSYYTRKAKRRLASAFDTKVSRKQGQAF